MEHQRAYSIAKDLASRLAPYCERIEVAGGLRRMKPDVHDLELIAVPKTGAMNDLLGNEVDRYSMLDAGLEDLVNSAILLPLKAGPRYKQFSVIPFDINLDLFIVLPPAQWGVIFALRTGPAEYSKWLVTTRSKGGALPGHLRVTDGALWRGGKLVGKKWTGGTLIETPEEIDFFRAIGAPLLPPLQRAPSWSRQHVRGDA